MICYRCGKKAKQSWEICSDKHIERHVCNKCDILLNELVLKFMRFRQWKSKMKRYKEYLTT